MGTKVCLLISLLVIMVSHVTLAAERDEPAQPAERPQRVTGRNASTDDASRVAIDPRFAGLLVPIGDEETAPARSVERPLVRGSDNPAFLLARARTAAAGGFTERAIVMLQQVLKMKPESSATREKILFEANRQLADLYEGAAYKSVYHLGIALQYAPDRAARAEIESRIHSLGGDVFDATFAPGASAASTMPRSHNDCATADPITPNSGFQTQSPGITTPGTYDWLVFTTPQDGIFRIETTPNAGSASDDTDLSLYDACPAVAGTCNEPPGAADPACIAFDDDSGSVGYSSLITTDCLSAGTYYVEVGGWLDLIAVGSFDISVETFDCPVELPLDHFEPDDERADGTSIGQPTSTPPGHSVAWGRVNRQTQRHTIAPGGDRDDVKFSLARNEMIRASVMIQHGSFFNDFESIPFDTEGESCRWGSRPCNPSIEMFYDKNQEWGGLCFDSGGFAFQTCNCPTDTFPGLEPVGGQICLSTAAAEIRNAEPRCSDPDDPEYPFVDCPYFGTPGGDSCPVPATASRSSDGCYNLQTNVSGDPFHCGPDGSLAPDCPPEPIAFNRDRSATDLGSELSFCLPATTPGTTDPSVNGPWHVQVTGLAEQQFEYEVRVTAEASCEPFEIEPNDVCENSQAITPGDTLHGMANNSTAQVAIHNANGSFTIPGTDRDLFSFNPPGVGSMVIETDAFSTSAADTTLFLYAVDAECVPLPMLFYYFDDDGGPGVLSRIVTPPLFPVPDNGRWIIEVGSGFLESDYPYTLHTSFAGAPILESEPNDVSEGAVPMEVQPGTTVSASIGQGCDFDTFRVPLVEDTFLTFRTSGLLDTTMQIVDCATAALIWNSCDDDGGGGTSSKIESCLPAGVVCVRVRGFSPFTTGDYDLSVRESFAGCVATDPPLVTAGRDFTCATTGAFETCP